MKPRINIEKVRNMKASDLMVGDWVYSSRECFKGNVKISGIDSHSLLFPLRSINAQDNSEIYYREDEIEPIPLTFEILVHCFKRDTLGCGWTLCSLDTDTHLRVGSIDGQIWLFMGYFSGRVEKVCILEYVHELQHILRQCHSDREIIL